MLNKKGDVFRQFSGQLLHTISDFIKQNTAILSEQNGDVIRHKQKIEHVTTPISAML